MITSATGRRPLLLLLLVLLLIFVVPKPKLQFPILNVRIGFYLLA